MGNPYMFTGRRWDDETETYYYRFRNYCPMLGRFMQNDPLGYVDGMNSYAVPFLTEICVNSLIIMVNV
ncbi:MAG: hypothetical protein JEZ07_16655 [Phycisphaerae bacterium]|nr:hypothetical protein [Phycisphaerae bacterium]